MLGARAEWRLGGVTLHVPSPPPLTLHSHGPGRGPCPHSKVLAQILSMPCIQKMGHPGGSARSRTMLERARGGARWLNLGQCHPLVGTFLDVSAGGAWFTPRNWQTLPIGTAFPPGAGLPHPAGGERPGPRAVLPSPHLP